ncbi:MAG: zinc transporter ZupT, partial [Candidatus Goldiibacteriota bacterium]
IYISIDELLPAAKKYGKEHTAITGVITGMIIMALGLDIMEHFF